MKQANRTLLIILLFSVIIPAATFLLPVPEGALGGTQGFLIATATSALLAWLHAGAAMLFLDGLAGFKPRLKRAYFIICFGLVATAISLMQFPILSIFNLFYSSWAVNGGTVLPVIGTLLIYGGLLAFATGLNIKHMPTQPWLVLPAGVLIAMVGGLAPGAFDVTLAGYWLSAVLCIAVVWLIIRIKQAAGPAYTNALAWFAIAPFVNTLGLLLVIVYLSTGQEVPTVAFIPFAFVGALYVKAGYAFNKIKEY